MAVIENFARNYDEMSVGSKYILFGGGALILILFIAMLYFIFDDKYSVLFSELDARDASSIIEQLDKAKIEYKLEENGSKILVKKDDVYKTRLNIINNVPALSGGVGFEIFDRDDFGTTEFAQKINYQRALQGELARTIMSLDEVKFARVHLVLPSTSIFKRNADQGRASVTLMLKNNKTLTQQQVAGVQKLVSSSTPGLLVKNVTIIDQKGVTLIGAAQDEHNIYMASQKLHRKQEIEKYLSGKAQTILNQTFGNSDAYVSIDVALNFDNIKHTREQVISPGDKDFGISHKKEIQMKGNKRQQSDTSRSTIEIDYKLGKDIEEIISTPGSIKRISIAIVTPPGLSQQQMDYVKSVVANAVGYDGKRGDMIAVTSSMTLKADYTQKQEVSSLPGQIHKTDNNSKEAVIDQDMAIPGSGWVNIAVARFIQLISDNPVGSFLIFALIMFITAYGVVRTLLAKLRKVPSIDKTRTMTDDERSRVLSEIREWLAVEKS